MPSMQVRDTLSMIQMLYPCKIKHLPNQAGA